MAVKRLSPTASLLRNSRLFSLPPPLPRPSHHQTATLEFDSDTATLPYPTHASIETTQSSLARGDWGLKRSLPQRSTARTSTPSIRIDDIDSIDHITEFESAGDHSLTLQKWHEIGLPLSMPVLAKGIGLPLSMPVLAKGANASHAYLNTRATCPKSVFEASVDSTERTIRGSGVHRWKYEGPWLAGKTEGDFQEYVQRDVKRRKLEFRNFVRDRLAFDRGVEQRRTAQESGKAVDGPIQVTEQDVDLHLKQLRHDRERLDNLVEEFLDLPPAEDIVDSKSQGSSTVMMDSDKGPPKTHLSAGLSYLRTASHTTNHPILGPMNEEPPTQARVLQPQNSLMGTMYCALLGVGGVVANDSTKTTMWKSSNDEKGIQSFDAETKGGAKIWVQPDRASFDAEGRVKMHVLRASKIQKSVYESVVSAPKQDAYKIASSPAQRMPPLDQLNQSRANAPRTSNEQYTYGLGVNRPNQPTTRAEPYHAPSSSGDSRDDIRNLVDAGDGRRSGNGIL
ncbi:MAG: hypothetical protein Q9183_000637 [Haloplaca sp. 2 TL-2023]